MPVDLPRAAQPLLIHTRRLLLRPLRPGDADALFAIYGDPQVMRYWSTVPWTSAGQGHDMVARDQAAGPDADWIRLGLVLPGDDTLIGCCTLFDVRRDSRRAELGYALARPWWRQGLMHEALAALIDHGFACLDLNRIEADIDPRNEASARLLGRLGFRFEGLLRERWIVGGEAADTAYYGLLQREWTAPRG